MPMELNLSTPLPFLSCRNADEDVNHSIARLLVGTQHIQIVNSKSEPNKKTRYDEEKWAPEAMQ